MQQQHQQRSFFGGLLSATQYTPEQPSPGAIRRSASLLLKKSTVIPPPPSLDVDGGVTVGSAGGTHRATRTSRHRRDDDDDAGGGVDVSESLELRVQRRDERLSQLQDELRASQSHLAKCARDDHALRRGLLESTHRHAVAVRLWRRTNDGLRARVGCFEAETTPDAAREIANLIRDAAPPNKDSKYLMMLQDQLTKATTKLEHLGSQTEIVLHKGEEVVESLREEMNEVIRERCRMELELLDQERMLEDDMRRMVVRTERRLRRVQGEIDYLEKNAMEVLKKQDEEEEEEENDDDDDDDDDDDGKDENDDKDIEDDEGGTKDGEDNDGKIPGEKCANNEEGVGDEADERHERDGGGVDGVDSKIENKTETSPESEVVAQDGTATSKVNHDEGMKEAQHTPESLRKDLRTLAMERDRTLSVLQKKLREKNEELHNLVRHKDARLKAISKMEDEKRDREEWARSRRGDVDETFLMTS